MAHVVVIGADLAGLPDAAELRLLLPSFYKLFYKLGRQQMVVWQEAWMSWAKPTFQRYCLARMRFRSTFRFEQLGLQGVNVSRMEPIKIPEEVVTLWR